MIYPKRKQRSEKMPPPAITARSLFMVVLCLLTAAAVIFTCTGCSDDKDSGGASAASPDESTPDSKQTAEAYDPLSFTKPDVPDDGTEGYVSASDPGLYIYHSKALELCGASDECAEDYAAAISEFKENNPDFTVYNMVAPIHTAFALPQRLIDSGAVYSADQIDNIKKIYTGYTADVQPINCCNALCAHMDEYIYFNTDHHWTGLGAYYAYEAFCEQTGQTALQLSSCIENKIEGFEGSFINEAEELADNIDTVSYWTLPYQTHAMCQHEAGDQLTEASIYQKGMEGSSAYLTFINGDSSLFIEYNDENKNGKKIAVVKESFGNAFVPYLTYNYEEVHVIDSRYYDGSLKDYMQENGITEILFLNNIMSANNPFQVDGIRDIF